MAYTKKIWENSPSKNTPLSAENLNNIENGIEDVDTRLTTAEGEIDNIQTGWVSANETWTYASVDDPTGVITISGDVTTKYSLGMRIKFTNGGNVIYGIITKLAYSNPNTTLTFLHEIDPTDSQALYLMQNSAITNTYYSNMKVPYGFPINPDKWTLKISTAIQYTQASPTNGSFYNLGNFYLDIHPGAWKVEYQTIASTILPTAGYPVIQTTLSTTNNSETDAEFSACNFAGTALVEFTALLNRSKNLNITTKTRYYFLIKGENDAINIFLNRNVPNRGISVISAVCAYL